MYPQNWRALATVVLQKPAARRGRLGRGLLGAALLVGTAGCPSSETRNFDIAKTATAAPERAPTAVIGSVNNAPPLTEEALGGPMPNGHPPLGGATSNAAAPLSTAPIAPPAGSVTTSMNWDVPARWKVLPNPSTFRKATYAVPRAASDAEDGELAVSEAGGELQQNIDRWAGQFAEKPAPQRTDKTMAGLKVTIIELRGTYNGMGVGGATAAKANYVMLAAIVQTGDLPYFFKLTGPSNTVAQARPEFDKLLLSLKKKQ
jgi:hypothetical protein